MIDRKGFKDWLQSNTDYSKNTISTFGNRLKMGDDLVPWFLPLADYMTKLEAMYGFKSLEPAVRSQIRKVMKLYADYQYSMLDRPIAADVEVLAAPEPAAAEPAAPEAETVTEPAPEPVYPEQQSLPEEESGDVGRTPPAPEKSSENRIGQLVPPAPEVRAEGGAV